MHSAVLILYSKHIMHTKNILGGLLGNRKVTDVTYKSNMITHNGKKYLIINICYLVSITFIQTSKHHNGLPEASHFKVRM